MHDGGHVRISRLGLSGCWSILSQMLFACPKITAPRELN
jgi:hypothetical protein